MKQLTDHEGYSRALGAFDAATTARASAQREVDKAQSRVDAAGAKANDTDEIDDVLAERAASKTGLEAARLRLELADELQNEKKAAVEAAKLNARRAVLDAHQERYDDILDSIAEAIETVLDAVDQAAELRRASEHAMHFASDEQRKSRFKLDHREPPGRALEELRRWAGLPLPATRRLGRGAPGRSRHEHAGTIQGESA